MQKQRARIKCKNICSNLWSDIVRTIKTVLYNDIFIPLRRKIVQGPAKQFKVSVRGLTMFVFYFGVETLEQCANLGRLVIFDFLGNSHFHIF